MITLQISGGHGSPCFCIIDSDGDTVVEEAKSAKAAAKSFVETGNELVNEVCQRRTGDVIYSERVEDLIDFSDCPLEAIDEFLSSLLKAYQAEESLIMENLDEEDRNY